MTYSEGVAAIQAFQPQLRAMLSSPGDQVVYLGSFIGKGGLLSRFMNQWSSNDDGFRGACSVIQGVIYPTKPADALFKHLQVGAVPDWFANNVTQSSGFSTREQFFNAAQSAL